MSPGDRLRGALELARPGNAVAAGVLTFTGALIPSGAFLGPGAPDELRAVAAAVIATVAATGAGNAINDYFDREIDRINRPDRPLPRGAVTPREALAFRHQTAVFYLQPRGQVEQPDPLTAAYTGTVGGGVLQYEKSYTRCCQFPG